MPKRKPGWTLYIVRCGDDSLFSGICRSWKLDDSVAEINGGKGYYFSTHPERLPVKVVFLEEERPFKEVYMKLQYLKKMNKPMKEKIVETKKWPLGRPIKNFGRKYGDYI